MNELIVLLSPASSVAILETSPSGPVIASYCPIAPSCAETICARTEWIESVSALACWTTACLAAWSSGFLERSDQDCQNFVSWALMPVSPGSASGELGGVQRLGARGPVGEVRVLAAVLRVQELVAHATEAFDIDAGAQVGTGRGRGARDLDLQRLRGREQGLLARVARGRGVRDVVAGRVEHPLLRDQAAQRRLHSVEA